MKKKLSILVNDLDTGGAERVVSILLFMLKDRYDITLFMIHDIIFYDIPKEIEVVIIGNANLNDSGLVKLLKLPILAWQYRKINRNSDISMSFLTRACYINILAKMIGMRAKVIINERAMPSLYYRDGLQGRINRFLIKKFYNRADIVVGNSKGNTLDLEENFNIRDTIVINNLFDIEKITKLSKGDAPVDEEFTFITIGRLDEGKNHILLIKAMQSVDAKLYIIGDGKLREYLEKQIEILDLKEKVFLLGKQKNPYKYLSKADCFAFASNHEGFPNVLVEALACELPVISTDCRSGPREILAPLTDINFQITEDIELAEYGILTPTDNVYSMTKAMNLIKEEKKLQDRYKEKSLIRAMDFDKDRIIDEFIKIL
ncbi:glycosyltransferase [Sulfurovum sp. bin170]|uniref:glycosyltransferase n=1 Tax=Sulfurovum sp. bin170 TaxID=2695268 RepID=UPI0013DFA5BB|nr:glycosyltransferase [Sulfurovum sp. bin170]NEW59760.1 glycosyltransferase [Sulfurovum sp. bin170]